MSESAISASTSGVLMARRPARPSFSTASKPPKLPVVSAFHARPAVPTRLSVLSRLKKLIGLRVDDLVVAEVRRAVPDHLAETAAIFGAFPDDADAGAEIAFAIGAQGFDQLEAVEDVDALDRRSRDDVDLELDLAVRQVNDVAHHGAGRRLTLRRPERRIVVVERSGRAEIGGDVDRPCARRGRRSSHSDGAGAGNRAGRRD